jgi:hypothetical protein
MFGGIDQLLRDSQDWVLRDQTQMALGFENWTGMDMDPAVWASGSISQAPTSNAVGGVAMNGMSMPDTSPVYSTNGVGAAMNNGYPVGTWLNGLHPYNNAAMYNEDEWYQ